MSNGNAGPPGPRPSLAPEGSIDALFAEKGIGAAYGKSIWVGVNRWNYIIPFIVTAVFFILIVRLDAGDLFALGVKLGDIGVSFAAGAIGLVLAAFALFAGFLDAEQKILFSREVDGRHGLSYLKTNMLPFIQFNMHFLVYLGASIPLSAVENIKGHMSDMYYSLSVDNARDAARYAAVVLCSAMLWMSMFVLMQVKSLCWNIYHQAMTSTALARHKDESKSPDNPQ